MAETTIKGLAALDKLLKELPQKLERNIIRSALRAGAKVIEDEAKQQLEGHTRTGQLLDSIRASVRLRKGVPVATIKAGGRGNKSQRGAFYAHMVEFGTAAHFIKPKSAKSLFIAGVMRNGVDHPGAQPVPFMRTAMDVAATAAVQAFGEQLKKRLTKQGLDTADIAIEAPET